MVGFLFHSIASLVPVSLDKFTASTSVLQKPAAQVKITCPKLLSCYRSSIAQDRPAYSPEAIQISDIRHRQTFEQFIHWTNTIHFQQEAHQLVGQAIRPATKIRPKAAWGGIMDRFLELP